MNEDAIRANDAGVELADARRWADAIPFYERALPLAPSWYAPHFNLGIALKHTGDFARSLEVLLRALDLDAERAGSGALWNVGIAATAVGDWSRARWAWSKLGIPIPSGEGPIDMNIGMTPIRVSPSREPEVVWCHRIDPARARIESIPTPESGRRYHDLVLHDGEPRGKRRLGEREVSVFDELALLERSPFQTWRVDVIAPSKDDLEALFREVAERSDAALEDWSESLEIMCKECSEGVPHEHAPRAAKTWAPERMLGVAARDDRVFRFVVAWAGAGGGRDASEPTLLLP